MSKFLYLIRINDKIKCKEILKLGGLYNEHTKAEKRRLWISHI